MQDGQLIYTIKSAPNDSDKAIFYCCIYAFLMNAHGYANSQRRVVKHANHKIFQINLNIAENSNDWLFDEWIDEL